VVNNFLTAGKLIPLLIFCGAGFLLLDLRPILQMPAPRIAPLQQASLLLIFALGGFESATIPSEEVIDPRRALPKALLSSISLVVVLYLAIQAVGMVALPSLASSSTPLASAAEAFLGRAGGLLLLAGAVCSTAGTNHVNTLASPRVMYAMARDGFLPARFATLHPAYRTPVWAILTFAGIGWVLALSSVFGPLAAIAVLTRLLIYTSTCLAVPVLRRRMRAPSEFVLPGGVTIPMLALAVCAWLLGGTTARQLAIVGAALAIGAMVYWLLKPNPDARMNKLHGYKG
jgi:basic amino acid/polyamine antiporter, APA family